MSSTVPYIGSKISLVSNSDIRYEGILYTINTQESTIALQSVRCCGTEGRKVPEIPPSSEIYDFIIFRGQDIKDLTVLESANPALSAQLNDPAIMSVNQRPPGSAAGGKGSGGGKGSSGAAAGGSAGYSSGGKGSYGGKGDSGGYGAGGAKGGGKGASQSGGGWGGWGASGGGWQKGGDQRGGAGGYGGAWGGSGYGSAATGKGAGKAAKGADSGKGAKGAGKSAGGKDSGKGGKSGGKDSGKGGVSAKGGKGGKDSGKGAGGAGGSGGRRGQGSGGAGKGSSGGGGDAANGTPVGELLPSANEAEKSKYAEEFDYEEENKKFDKNTLEGEEVEEKLKPLSGYDKGKSFFDSISCEATERAGDAERPKVDRNKARQNDRETFGDTRRPPRPTGGRRGKGGGGGGRRGPARG